MSLAAPKFARWRLRKLDREIFALAVPALGALIAEPLFRLTDSVMVGHLGSAALAGLGLAAAILQTIVGLMIFLAYGTTPAVARSLGQGDRHEALAIGVDSLWMALALGLALTLAGLLAAPLLIAAFSPAADVARQAAIYLRWSMAGLPAMLIVFAASGLLRGLQDTRTPLWVASAGFGGNIVLNYLLMYVLHWGIAGAAIGSVLAQWGMVAAYLLIIGRHRRAAAAPLWPRWAGVRLGMADGSWLFLRTLTMRAAVLLTVYVTTVKGRSELAAFHIAITLFNTLAFALDALAIAAQALIGHRLGAGRQQQTRIIVRRCIWWGLLASVLLGGLLLVGSTQLGALFTTDASVRSILPPALRVLALGVPVGAVVWVLDGVLMGAGDMRYLGLAGIVNLLLFLPFFLLLLWLAPDGASGLAWIMVAFVCGYLGARLVTLAWRLRGDAWMQAGARR